MTEPTRRGVIAGAAGIVALGAFGARAQTLAATTASLQIQSNRLLNYVPASYCGFSIEQMTLENPSIYSAKNDGLVAIHRRVSTTGVLRIGGNSSEFCWWRPTSSATPPPPSSRGFGRPDNWMPQAFHAITPAAIKNLRDFLDATGWTCIYGLNFGNGSPDANAAHADFVAKTLGPRLRYFQIGNEPDFYGGANNMLRAPGWNFDSYLSEWIATATAVIERVPSARFGGPDVGSTPDWIVKFGRRARPVLGERLVELSGHYYAKGPPGAADATIEGLLKPDLRVRDRMAQIMPVARAERLGFRMSEGNSCFSGGKAGLSNAFASALWGMDYMLQMASLGCSGINLHGGGGSEISHSLGDHLPGARNQRDIDIAKLGSFYSPFQGNPKVGYEARPLLYAVMAVQAFSETQMVDVDFDPGKANATAFAAEAPDGWRVALVNKDAERDVTVRVQVPPATRSVGLWRLSASSLDATEGVTLGGAAVAPRTSDWTPEVTSAQVETGGIVAISLPRASATVVFLGR